MRIQCSRCGAVKGFTYTESNIRKALIEGWDSYGDALYCPGCAKTWNERNDVNKPLWGEEHTKEKINQIHKSNKRRRKNG